jgi:trigger factor
LNITVEYPSSLEARLTLSLTPDDYQPRVDKALKDLRKNIKMPGFRPGMVPSGLVLKNYGMSVLQEELSRVVNDQLINDMKFDSLVAALNYRMNNLERDVAWVDNVEVK